MPTYYQPGPTGGTTSTLGVSASSSFLGIPTWLWLIAVAFYVLKHQGKI
jgi:hypothetical protein